MSCKARGSIHDEPLRLKGGSMLVDRMPKQRLLLVILLTAMTAGSAQAASMADSASRITKEEAKALLGAPKVVFVDARVSKAWSGSDQRIPGAVQPDKWDLESWAGTYDRDTTFIVY